MDIWEGKENIGLGPKVQHQQWYSSTRALLLVFLAQLRKTEHIQAPGVFTHMGMCPREPLGTGNLGVVETNDWKCFLSEAICNMLLILPHHKINSLSTFLGAIKEMSTIPEKFIYQAFNWKVPKLLRYQDFAHAIRLSKLSQSCNIAPFLFLYKMHCAVRRPSIDEGLRRCYHASHCSLDCHFKLT